MQVREGMSETVLTIGPSHTLRDAAEAMCRRNVGAAVVVDPDAQGPSVITERDILQAVGCGEDPDRELVSDHADLEPDARLSRLVARAGGGDDGPGPLPPPGRVRRRRARGHPVDAGHHALLDRGRRHERGPGRGCPASARGFAAARGPATCRLVFAPPPSAIARAFVHAEFPPCCAA